MSTIVENKSLWTKRECAEWLGHTEQIADKHYRMATEEHFQRACRDSGAKNGAAQAGNHLQINEATNKKAVNCSVLQPTTDVCEVKDSQGGTLCNSDNILQNNNLYHLENPDCAKMCALSDNSPLSSNDQQALQTIISLWPTLAPETKIGILQAIESERLAGC